MFMDLDSVPILDLSLKKTRYDSVDSCEEGRVPPSDKAGGGTYKKNLMKRYCK